jgi:hypothetical protein
VCRDGNAKRKTADPHLLRVTQTVVRLIRQHSWDVRLGSGDGQKAAKQPNAESVCPTDDRAPDDTDDGVESDKRSSLTESVRSKGDDEGVDCGEKVGWGGEAEGGDGGVAAAGEDLADRRQVWVLARGEMGDGDGMEGGGGHTTGKKSVCEWVTNPLVSAQNPPSCSVSATHSQENA